MVASAVAISGYRLASGTLTVAAMDSGAATYAIENFTRQNDMSVGRVWLRPKDEADVIDFAAEYVDGLSGIRGGLGRPVIQWTLQGLTPLMVKYIRDTFFSGTNLYGDVTARTFNRGVGAWQYYNGRAQWSSFKDSSLVAGGYDLPLTIIKCVPAASGA